MSVSLIPILAAGLALWLTNSEVSYAPKRSSESAEQSIEPVFEFGNITGHIHTAIGWFNNTKYTIEFADKPDGTLVGVIYRDGKDLQDFSIYKTPSGGHQIRINNWEAPLHYLGYCLFADILSPPETSFIAKLAYEAVKSRVNPNYQLEQASQSNDYRELLTKKLSHMPNVIIKPIGDNSIWGWALTKEGSDGYIRVGRNLNEAAESWVSWRFLSDRKVRIRDQVLSLDNPVEVLSAIHRWRKDFQHYGDQTMELLNELYNKSIDGKAAAK